MREFARSSVLIAVTILSAASLPVLAANTKFHNAPDSVRNLKNPYDGNDAAAKAGGTLYARNCLSCHGKAGKGTGNVPSLVSGNLDDVSYGEVFWFVTKGSKENGMPSWAQLPEQQRWKIVTYVKSVLPALNAQQKGGAAPADTSTATFKAPPPTPPFTDFRYEKPGTVRKITVKDLPEPYATKSAENGPALVARPANV